MSQIQLVDKRMPAGDSDKHPMQQTWYAILLGEVVKDPTLAGQLDVGPPPQHREDLDRAVQRMQLLYLVHDPERPIGRQFCGVAGALVSPVLYPTPLFASILPINREGRLPQDVQVLADTYRLLAEYLTHDRDIRNLEARAIEGIHAEALLQAGFSQACRIPKNIKLQRKYVDQLLFTFTGE